MNGAQILGAEVAEDTQAVAILERAREVECLNPVSDEQWTRRLAACGNDSVFFQAGWAAVLVDTYGYRPRYLAGLNEGNEQALLPLMEVDSVLTGRRGTSLPFTDECEPIAAGRDSFQPLFDQALAEAALRGWRYIELRGGRRFLPSAQASQQFYVHEVELRAGEGALFNSLESSVRRAIRKAEKCGLTIDMSQDLAAVKDFYSLQCLTRRKHGLPPQPFKFFANLQRHILAKGQGMVVVARAAGKPVAANVFLHSGRRAMFKFGASDHGLQDLRGSDLVMWAGLKHYAAKGFASLNLGRTSLTNEGLRRFKLGWGARERLLEYFKYDLRRHGFVQSRDEAFGWYNRLFAVLPGSISRLAGRLLYRHIA